MFPALFAAPAMAELGTAALLWGTRAVGFVAVSTVGVFVGNKTLEIGDKAKQAIGRSLKYTGEKFDPQHVDQADAEGKTKAEKKAKQTAAEARNAAAEAAFLKAIDAALDGRVEKLVKEGKLFRDPPSAANEPRTPPATKPKVTEAAE